MDTTTAKTKTLGTIKPEKMKKVAVG